MVDPPRDLVELAERFAEVARALAGDDLDGTLQSVVALAVETIPHCEGASVTVVRARQVASPAASHEWVTAVDRIQQDLGEGPCLDAIREHETYKTGDLLAERRWPTFAQRVHDETRVRSVLSIRLFLDEDTLGALNLYSTHENGFDDTDVALGAVFAAHAAVAMSTARREEQLEEKLASRDVIGRAKGILMAQSGLDDEEAFDLLRRASQRLNIKLAQVAKQITERQIPGAE